MAKFFPRGRERPAGVCRLCGGQVVVRWADKFCGEYHCQSCGECTSTPGIHLSGKVRRDDTDLLWAGMEKKGITEMDVQVWLKLVNEVAVRRGHERSGMIDKGMLQRWGYEVIGTKIRKR